MAESWTESDKVLEYVDRVGKLPPRQSGEFELLEALPDRSSRSSTWDAAMAGWLDSFVTPTLSFNGSWRSTLRNQCLNSRDLRSELMAA